MQYFDLNEIGVLVLRLTVAYIYLHGAYMIGSTKKRRLIGIQRTSILFGDLNSNNYQQGLTKLAFLSALSLMSIGSLLILSGISIKIGALMLIIFTIPAILVHKRESKKSHLLADRIIKGSNDAIHEEVHLLANFSHAGHRSSGNKNYMLLAVNIYLYLMDNSTSFLNILI